MIIVFMYNSVEVVELSLLQLAEKMYEIFENVNKRVLS